MNQYVLFKLKPMCDALLLRPTLENAKKFNEELKQHSKTSERIPHGASDLILFPTLMLVDQINSRNANEIKTYVIDSVTILIKCIRIQTLISLRTIQMVLLNEIYVEGSKSVVPNLSEEFKLSVLNCFEAATRYVNSDVIENYYVPESRLIIAKILSVCVTIVDWETFRKLRIAAINCILSVLYVHDDVNFSDIALRHPIADLVFFMLPKIVYTCRNVAIGDEKQGETIIILSIKALARVLHLILEDEIHQEPLPTISDIKNAVENSKNKQKEINSYDILNLKSYNEKGELEDLNSKKRTKEWMEIASKKLLPVFEALQKLIGNKNKMVRIELAKFAECLLNNCYRNMPYCIAALLKIQIALSEEYDSQLSPANEINDMIENIFISHLTKLPRIIYTGDEEEQMAGFNVLGGLIRTLSKTDHIKISLAPKHVLNKLLSVLLASVELESPMQLLEDQISFRIRDINADECTKLGTPSPWKTFKSLRNPSLTAKLRHICQLLSQNTFARELVLTSLLKSFCKNSSNCNEILILFQNFILTEKPKDGKCSTLDAAILEEILSYTHWGLGLQVTSTTDLQKEELGESRWYEDHTEGLYESAISMRMSDIKWASESPENDDRLTIGDVKFNVLHTCLILETVATYAFYLGSDFQPYLLNSLHRILEKSGSSNYMVHCAGIHALLTLKSALNISSISELIFQNADYIAFFINKSLRRVDESKSALEILSVVIKYSSLDSIPHLENIITTVMAESAKPYQLRNTLYFLNIFHMILQGISVWLLKNCTEPVENKTESPKIEDQNDSNFYSLWVDMIRKEDDLNDDLEEENIPLEEKLKKMHESLHEEDNEEQTNEEVSETPAFIKFTINILKRCIRYVSSKNRNEKLVALDTICVGLEIIKPYENELLPIVHLVWQPFAERVHDKDPIILRKCFTVLHILAKHAKDFIYKRTATEILPFLIKFLKETVNKDTKHTRHSYELSQDFKLQKELLSNLPSIVMNIQITEREFNNILDAVIPLLSKTTHPELQKLCVIFLLQLTKYDHPAVYGKLDLLKNQSNYVEAVSTFFPNE